jgi:small conductance mechanosensitive channel
MTLDGNHLRIPNSTVFKAVILNYTRNPQRRFEFDLGDADGGRYATGCAHRATGAGRAS